MNNESFVFEQITEVAKQMEMGEFQRDAKKFFASVSSNLAGLPARVDWGVVSRLVSLIKSCDSNADAAQFQSALVDARALDISKKEAATAIIYLGLPALVSGEFQYWDPQRLLAVIGLFTDAMPEVSWAQSYLNSPISAETQEILNVSEEQTREVSEHFIEATAADRAAVIRLISSLRKADIVDRAVDIARILQCVVWGAEEAKTDILAHTTLSEHQQSVVLEKFQELQNPQGGQHDPS